MVVVVSLVGVVGVVGGCRCSSGMMLVSGL